MKKLIDEKNKIIKNYLISLVNKTFEDMNNPKFEHAYRDILIIQNFLRAELDIYESLSKKNNCDEEQIENKCKNTNENDNFKKIDSFYNQKCWNCDNKLINSMLGNIKTFYCEIKECKNCNKELVIYWKKKDSEDILNLDINKASVDEFEDIKKWKESLISKKSNSL